jgi:hypothetical protein
MVFISFLGFVAQIRSGLDCGIGVQKHVGSTNSKHITLMFPYCQLCHAVVEDGLRRVSSFFNL